MATVRVEIRKEEIEQCLNDITKTREAINQLQATLDRSENIIQWLLDAVNRYDDKVSEKKAERRAAILSAAMELPPPQISVESMGTGLATEFQQLLSSIEEWPVQISAPEVVALKTPDPLSQPESEPIKVPADIQPEIETLQIPDIQPKVEAVPEPVVKTIINGPVMTITSEQGTSFGLMPEFQQLLGLIEEWPVAVDPKYICNSQSIEDRLERAKQILEMMIEEPIEGKTFLDYGCGEGDCVALAKEFKAVKAIGYDIKLPNPKPELTTSWEEVANNGPYDIVLIYDVLDHSLTEEPIAMLSKLKPILKPTSRIYMRCHPYCSRHGSHLYNNFNAAYAHLVFTEEELKIMRFSCEPTRKIIFPVHAYKNIIKEAGFKEVLETIVTEDVNVGDGFFLKNEIVKKRIMDVFKLNNFPQFQLSVSFVDYILKLPEAS